MTKYFRLVLMALVSIAFIGCEMFNKKQTDFRLSDLQGKWCKDNTQEYKRFTTDPVTDETGFFWGCEWNEAEDVHESYLVVHGDGWFKYKLTDDQLIEWHMTDYGWADIPQEYVLEVLTSTKMTYYKKGYPKDKPSFTKQ